MDGENLHKKLETLEDTTSTEKVLSGEYYLPVDVA